LIKPEGRYGIEAPLRARLIQYLEVYGELHVDEGHSGIRDLREHVSPEYAPLDFIPELVKDELD